VIYAESLIVWAIGTMLVKRAMLGPQRWFARVGLAFCGCALATAYLFAQNSLAYQVAVVLANCGVIVVALMELTAFIWRIRARKSGRDRS
jgi:drug/metabolite transporter (DMT)-like permease